MKIWKNVHFKIVWWNEINFKIRISKKVLKMLPVHSLENNVPSYIKLNVFSYFIDVYKCIALLFNTFQTSNVTFQLFVNLTINNYININFKLFLTVKIL